MSFGEPLTNNPLVWAEMRRDIDAILHSDGASEVLESRINFAVDDINIELACEHAFDKINPDQPDSLLRVSIISGDGKSWLHTESSSDNGVAMDSNAGRYENDLIAHHTAELSVQFAMNSLRRIMGANKAGGVDRHKTQKDYVELALYSPRQLIDHIEAKGCITENTRWNPGLLAKYGEQVMQTINHSGRGNYINERQADIDLMPNLQLKRVQSYDASQSVRKGVLLNRIATVTDLNGSKHSLGMINNHKPTLSIDGHITMISSQDIRRFYELLKRARD